MMQTMTIPKMNDREKRRFCEKSRDRIFHFWAVFRNVPRDRNRRFWPETADFEFRDVKHLYQISDFVQMSGWMNRWRPRTA